MGTWHCQLVSKTLQNTGADFFLTTKPFLGVSLLNGTEDLPERHDNECVMLSVCLLDKENSDTEKLFRHIIAGANSPWKGDAKFFLSTAEHREILKGLSFSFLEEIINLKIGPYLLF